LNKKREYKVWKEYVALKKPNKIKCRLCNKSNSEWKDLKAGGFVHRMCIYKFSHYGMTPTIHSKWRRELIIVRKIVLERDNYTCVKCKNNCENCKRDLKEKGKIKLQVHHIIPVRKGGPNSLDNLITVCQFCNQRLDSKRLN